MAVNINVPSQVRTFANLAAFPATGALKTIYIAEDTNKTYRWTGSVYVEVSGADFSGYVPTSRTLTINGVTQDLSADRTYTISTGITIGTTAITSGTVGRVLFQGTGNVVQQSSSLFWDNTNTGLSILSETSTSAERGVLIKQFNNGVQGALSTFQKSRGSIASPANVAANDLVGLFQFSSRVGGTYTSDRAIFGANMATSTGIGLFFSAGSSDGNYIPSLYIHPSGNAVFGSNQSILTGITDAGFRLDVNGTARVVATHQIYRNNQVGAIDLNLYNGQSGWQGGMYYNTGAGGSGQRLTFYAGGAGGSADGLTIFPNRNVLIQNGGTHTDAGFRLDVNGTARVQSGFQANGNVIYGTSNGFYWDSATQRLGIGTSTPQAFLHFNNATGEKIRMETSGTLSNFISIYNSGVSLGYIGKANTTTDLYYMNSSAANLILGTNNLERLRIFSTGNVGINTTTDAGFRLDVNGTARVQGNFNQSGLFFGMSVTGYWTINNTGNSTGFGSYISQQGMSYSSSQPFCFNVASGAHATSASVQIDSTTKGFLPPRMTTTQKNAIATPATGLQVYDTTLNRPCFYDGTTWITL